jgi:eukaryotic-like serine/threonine-protein kinase
MTVSGTRSSIAACRGQIRTARDFGQKSREAAERLGLKELTGTEYSQESLMEAAVLNKSRALEDAAQSVKISQSPISVLVSALALAVAGNDKKAEDLANNLAQKRPYDTFVQFIGSPAVHAQVDLNHNNPAKAIDLLDNAMVYARANTTLLYFRGNAYLTAGRGGDAVQAFQRTLEIKGYAGIDPLMPLANLGLARAYALAGDKARSPGCLSGFSRPMERCCAKPRRSMRRCSRLWNHPSGPICPFAKSDLHKTPEI